MKTMFRMLYLKIKSFFFAGSFKSQLIDYFRGHVTSCPKQVSFMLIRTKWRLCMSWHHFGWILRRSQLLCSWRNFYFYFFGSDTWCLLHFHHMLADTTNILLGVFGTLILLVLIAILILFLLRRWGVLSSASLYFRKCEKDRLATNENYDENKRCFFILNAILEISLKWGLNVHFKVAWQTVHLFNNLCDGSWLQTRVTVCCFLQTRSSSTPNGDCMVEEKDRWK